MLTFPFGMPIKPVQQEDRSQKRVFVLGVYASAVHALWLDDKDDSVIINALAVASEPEIFWRGDKPEDIVAKVKLAVGAGSLVPASRTLNGPSGIALDELFLAPLGVCRDQAWLCDLLPESTCKPNQAAALGREYLPRMARLGLPSYQFPPVPKELMTAARATEVEEKILEASPSVLVTLGDPPLKWFASRYRAQSWRPMATVSENTVEFTTSQSEGAE
jgi:uracil-DNA glycosylase